MVDEPSAQSELPQAGQRRKDIDTWRISVRRLGSGRRQILGVPGSLHRLQVDRDYLFDLFGQFLGNAVFGATQQERCHPIRKLGSRLAAIAECLGGKTARKYRQAGQHRRNCQGHN